MAELSTIKGLIMKIRATRLHLGILRCVEAFWPALVLVAGFAILSFIGFFELFSVGFGALLAVSMWLATGFLVWRGWKKLRLPTELEARYALDQSSELRPIHSLTDNPSEPTPEGEKLWDEHTDRLEKAAKSLPLPWFGKVWRALDPYYLRAVLPALLIGSVFLAGGQAGNRFFDALTPDIGVLMGADDVTVEAWITPPEHTRRPPVFLRTDLGEVRVPAGSEVTLRAQARSAPKLVLRGTSKSRGQRFDRTPDGAYETQAILTEDTKLTVNWWGKRAGWSILASEDEAPTAEFVMVPVLGANDQTELTWKVSDDYGVIGLELAMRLVEPNPAAPDEERRQVIELSSPSLKEGQEDAVLDMTRHAWAGLMVEARLVATDGGGHEGYSAPHEFVLPEKLFLQSLAKAAQEVRVTALRESRPYGEIEAEFYKDADGKIVHDADGTIVHAVNRLEAAPEGIQRASLMLEALTYAPYRFFSSYEPYLGLSSAQADLKVARTLEEAQKIDGLLWAVALKAEYGSAADALAALLAAKKALEKALRDGASEEEIARLTDAFRQAAENYVQAKLAEAIANGLSDEAAEQGLDNEQAGGGQGLGQNSFEEMLSALEDLTETGATDQARQLLSDITNMLENLEFQQGNGSGGDGFALPNEGGEGEEGEQNEEQQELAEQIEELADALREQQELNDDTLESGRAEQDRRRQEAQNNQQGGQQSGQQSGQQQGGQQGGQQSGQQSGDQQSGGGQAQAGENGGGLTPEELAQRQAEIGQLLQELADARGAGSQEGGQEEGEAGGSGEEGGEERGGGGGLDADALENVLNAQRRAEQALRDGRFSSAQRQQQRITDGLRELAGALAAELDQLRGEDGGDDEQLDPFGNPTSGSAGTGDVEVPEQSERQRALDILEELRKRYNEASDPEEREYLKRLLDRF